MGLIAYPTLCLTLSKIPLFIRLLAIGSVSVYKKKRINSYTSINAFIYYTKKVLLEQPTLTPSTQFFLSGTMSKGDKRRPQSISDADMNEKWQMIFNSPYKKHWKKTKKRVVQSEKRNTKNEV